MSYDLMAFNPAAAPRRRDDFLKWYHSQTESQEPHTYDDPKNVELPLREWLEGFIKDFPPMNGPFAAPDEMIDDPHVTDYSMGKNAVYCCFAWSLADEAYQKMKGSTARCGVGFFNVSATKSEIVFPDLVL
jgi:hypothetical protein